MTDAYEVWLDQVRDALRSINMPMEDWQKTWAFDFAAEYQRGTSPDAAATKANRFWWSEQNKSIGRACEKVPGCWLPRGHQGECEPISTPTYQPGDYVKVEFPSEAGMPSEWMPTSRNHRGIPFVRSQLFPSSKDGDFPKHTYP